MANLTKYVLFFVGAALLSCIVIVGILAVDGKPIPDLVQNVTVGCLTGLLGLLVPARTPPGANG